MPRRARRLIGTLVVALLVAGAVATLAARRHPPQPATAAEQPCRPQAGSRMLGTALLHVPRRATAPLPLVIAFHGAGGTGPQMAHYSGLSATADEQGFAVLYPTAATRRHFWSLNASMPGDDVDRLRALLPQAMTAACVDPDRVFATGVSNGGGFAARVGCELGGTIAAVAPVAGGYRALEPCPDGQRTSVLEIHGTADHVVPYAGRPPEGAGAVATFVAGWARRDGCAATPVRTRVRRGVLRFSHPGCAGGLRVQHLRLEGTDHGWPGADPPFPRRNPSELEAGEAVWEFFSRTARSRAARGAAWRRP